MKASPFLVLILLSAVSPFLLPGQEAEFFRIAAPVPQEVRYRPGETVRTVFTAEKLKTRQGMGSATWHFKYYINGHLSHITDTESYSGFQDGPEWLLEREKAFTVSPAALRGNHRIEIILKDNNSGELYRGSVRFTVEGMPLSAGEKQAVAARPPGDGNGDAVVLPGHITVRLFSLGERDGVLACTLVVTSAAEDIWLGFTDARLIDSGGREHQAIVGGTIQGDGEGGLDLAAGIPMKGEVFFDSFAAEAGSIPLLEIRFSGGLTGRWENIPNPYP